MSNRAKPFLIAAALALGASAPAFAQTATDNTMNPSLYPQPTRQTRDVTISGAPIRNSDAPRVVTEVNPPAAYPPAASPSAAYPPAVQSTTTTTTTVISDEDARERAQRAATKASEEEHGGTRNRVKQKKERTREKMGLGHDDD